MNAKVIRAAARYHAALAAGLSLVGSRSLRDGPTETELLMESTFGHDLRPGLSAMYWRPIEAGLAELAEQDRDEIVRTVLAYYRDRPDVIAPAQATLGEYARRGFNLGGQMGLNELDLLGQFELSDEYIEGVLEAHVERLVSPRRQSSLSVAVTTAEEIGREVERQAEEGLSVTDMLPALSAWVLGRTVIRSANIAATEAVRMTRWGMMWAFAGNGIRGVRHECEADVERRCTTGLCPPLCGTEYDLGGVFHPMSEIPGASQIPLHPRCILPGNEVIVPGRLSAAAKSFYHGRAIEIVVGDGRVLTVTENHPILTPRGYIAAKFLRQGDYVLSAADGQRIAAAVNPDDDHAPTAIEEVFRAFKESPFVVSRVVPHSSVDFHGDGRNVYGDIDVVFADRLLEGRGAAARGEHLGQLALGGNGVALHSFLPLGDVELLGVSDGSAAGGIVGGGYLLGAGLGGHLRPFEEFGFGSAAGLDTCRQQAATNWKSSNAHAISNGLLGFAGQVSVNDSFSVQLQAELAAILKYAGLTHETGDSALRHALFAREFVDRFATDITVNEVVGIREFNFTGHVYDLQSDDYELYITSGIITSNCRCYYSPLTDGWLKPALIWTGFALGALE